jgi:hypothetical protein
VCAVACVSVSAMAGRGRGATLPAWMTKAGGAVPGHSDRDSGSAQGAAPAAPSPALRVAATAQSSFAASAPAVRSVPQDTMYGRQQGNGGHMGGYGQAPSMGGYGQAPSIGGYGQPPQGAGGYGRGAYGAGMPGAYSMGGGGGGGIPAGAAGGYGAMASGAPAARVIKGNSIEAQPSGPSKSVWSVNEADGRTYYYNTVRATGRRSSAVYGFCSTAGGCTVVSQRCVSALARVRRAVVHRVPWLMLRLRVMLGARCCRSLVSVSTTSLTS